MAYLVNSFAFGEISPELMGRLDAPYYRQACRTLQNMLPKPTGPATRRPGTYYAATTKGNATAILIPWYLSETDARILEVTEDAVRFYKVGTDGMPARVLDGSTIVEVDISSWSLDDDAGDLPLLRYAQDSTSALYDTMFFCCGQGASAGVGRIALKKITRTSDTSWAAAAGGASGTNYPAGNPTNISMFQDRMCLSYLNQFCFSKSNAHTDFGVSSPLVATDAGKYAIFPDHPPNIGWMLAGNTLCYGTPSGAWRVSGNSDILSGVALAIIPTQQAGVGGSKTQGVVADDIIIFVQKNGLRLHSFAYQEAEAKYMTTDLNFLASHIIESPVKQIAYQREPEPTLWAVTDDGQLLSMAYSRQMQSVGWARHDLGGTVESVAVIPGANEDYVWVIVNRTIEDATVRYVEMLAPRAFDSIEDCHYVDSGIVWDGGAAKTVTSITAADPAVCTATGHGFENDELVRFSDVTGITAVNQQVYMVKNKATDTFQLYSRDGTTAIDFSAETEAGAAGTVEQVIKTVTGLSHLEGETVSILGDGATIADEVVASGAVTMDEYANQVHIGLKFESILEPTSIADGPGMLKKIRSVFLKLYKSVTAEIGPDTDHLTQVTFQYGEPTMDTSTLVTGNLKESFPGDYNFDGNMSIFTDSPLPLTVLSIAAEVDGGS